MSDLCAEIRQALGERFNESELRTLATDVGIEYEDLPGAAKSDKARELVAWFERRRQLGRLISAIEGARPDLDLAAGGTIIGCERVHLKQRRPIGKSIVMETPAARTGIDRQVERLADSMEGMRNDLGQLKTDVRLLQADMTTIKRQVRDLEEYIRVGPPMSRQTTLTLLLGVAVIVLVAALVFLAGWK